MIARGLAGRRIIICQWHRPLTKLRQRPVRKYSTSHSLASNPGITSSPFAALGSITSELDGLGPRFDIEGSQIEILSTPIDFYESLKVQYMFLLIQSRLHFFLGDT